MKYIATDTTIVIFSTYLIHSDVARSLEMDVTGAGFIDLENKKTYGESTSLGIKSRPEDIELLN